MRYETTVRARVDAVIRHDGRRIPVRFTRPCSRAWAYVRPVPVLYDNAWKLIKNAEHRVSPSRLEPVQPGDYMWWRIYA